MQLKTTRLAAKDLISTFPAGLAGLETDLASLFGFTMDSDVTETPIGLSNDGKVTKPLLRSYGRDTFSNPMSGPITTLYGIGLAIENATNKYNAALSFESEGGSIVLNVRGKTTDGLPSNGNNPGSSIFQISTDSGALAGYTTQDGSSTPLFPSTGGVGSSYFYNAIGGWAVPSNNLGSQGCGLYAGAGITLDPSASATAYTGWTDSTQNRVGWDDGGFFTSANPSKVTVPTGYNGKYAYFLSFCMESGNATFGLDATVEVKKNGSTTIAKQDAYHGGGDPPFENVARIVHMYGLIDMISADYLEVYVTNNNAAASIIIGYDDGSVTGRAFPGRFEVTRIE